MSSSVRFLTIASSSRGNAHAIDADGHLLLIDCGVAPSAVSAGLSLLGRRIEDAEAVLVTHTHTDHVAGLWSLLRKIETKVFGPQSLAGDVANYGGEFNQVSSGGFALNGFVCSAFKLPHDCEPTFGYRVEIGGKIITVATDLGEWTDEVLANVEGSDVLVWEANHDKDMLWGGRYPERLKRRIAGAKGHLSNGQAAEGIEALDRLPARLLLGHLSRENNTEGRVLDAFEERHLDKHMEISVCDPYDCGTVIEL